MAKLRDHQSTRLTKMLLLGDSGSGKTGALTSLAEAGYDIRILDLDNGLDVLVGYLMNSKAPPINGIEAIDRVEYITVTNKFKDVAGKIAVADASAWSRTMKYMTQWTNKNEMVRNEAGEIVKDDKGAPLRITPEHPDFFDFGKPENWGPSTILVIDSFTFLCNAAMKFVLHSNGRPAGPTYEADWGIAQNMVEDFLAMLYGEDFNTNIILTAHVLYRDLGQGTKAYPNALGRALPPKVGRYVNTMLEVSRVGTGEKAKREIRTVPHGLLDLKNPNPLRVPPKYDISTGLAQFFEDVRKK